MGRRRTAIIAAAVMVPAICAGAPASAASAPVEVAKLIASDAAPGDTFGSPVSLSSDGATALVGATGRDGLTGAAYVFARSGSAWSQQAELTASDAAGADTFGDGTLSGDGVTALIGAAGVDSATGAAYIFTRSLSAWTQRAKITATGGQPGEGFGGHAAMNANGTIAVIGAQHANGGTGAAYVFTGSGSTWTQRAVLTSSDAAVNDSFGDALALSGDGQTLLVGAWGKDTNTGAAYVYTGSGSTWTQRAKLTAVGGASGDLFGFSISLSTDGGTMLIGAQGKQGYTGGAYVFSGNGSTWTQRAALTPSEAVAGDEVGFRVSLSGDGLSGLLGAPHPGSSIGGAAYGFATGSGGWSEVSRLTASDASAGDNFGVGTALDSSGVTGLIGANQIQIGDGAAYVFSIPASPVIASPTATAAPAGLPKAGAGPDSLPRVAIALALAALGLAGTAYGANRGLAVHSTSAFR